MNHSDEELNKFGKRILSPLSQVDPLDPASIAQERAKFLVQVEHLRTDLPLVINNETEKQSNREDRIYLRKQRMPLFRALIAVLVVVILLAGSSATVFAAQNSLPGEPLYAIKSLSEDVRFAVALNPQTKLDLTLTYTNRRAEEISSLVANGEELPAQTSNRYQLELEQALDLAAQMNDQQMQAALIQIRNGAEKQGMTMQELLAKLPEQASPAILRLQERLQEQVILSSFGESDPQAFRNEIRERQKIRQSLKHSTEPEQTEEIPLIADNTPMPGQDNDGIEMGQPTQIPGHNGQGNSQDETLPGNGNHGPGPTHSPKP
jgi:hypothetical protein